MESPEKRPVAIVTGASSGVGWLAALRLAKEGYDLCIFSRREPPLQRLATEIRKSGARCLVVPGDVTRQEDVERCVKQCENDLGRIDLLVNNAAVQCYAKFEDYMWEEITRINDVNFFGYLRFARAVLPRFQVQHKGLIVNVLSIMAQGGLQLFSMYAATKHGLLGWAKCLKLELAGSGVEISTVILPAMNTPLYDHCATKMGSAPKPLPPIYDPGVAVRAIMRAVKHPRKLKHIPVFLQGRLILWTDYMVPIVGNVILEKIGIPWQKRPGTLPPGAGNLWEPLERGTGPRGTLRETPAWIRFAPLWSAGLIAAAAGLLGATHRTRRRTSHDYRAAGDEAA